MGLFGVKIKTKNESKMVKQILILLILSVTCFWGEASNNDNANFHGDISSPAVRNTLKFNYDQLAGINDEKQTNFSDDFNLPQLRSLWQLNAKECSWTLNERPGFLRIKAQKTGFNDRLIHEKTLSQKVKCNTSGEAVVLFDLANLSVNTNAGLYFSSKRINYIGIETVEGEKCLVVKVNDEVIHGPIIHENSVMLRIVFEVAKARFEFSFDGMVYNKLGSEFKLNTLKGDNNCIGLYCMNENNEKGSVDIDWFYFIPIIDNETKFAEITYDIKGYPEL